VILKFAIRRLLVAIPVALITFTLIFFVLRVLPGDPAVAILGDNASAEALANLREKLGLNAPLWQQYMTFLVEIFRGNFGTSITTGRPVTELIISLFPYTLELAFASILLAVLIGVPIGIISALKRNTMTDGLLRIFALLGISIPAFFLGILLLLAFSLKMPVFPSIGAGKGLADNLYHLVLPAFSLALIEAGLMMRITRSTMLDQVNQDYVRTARAKGIPEGKVIYKHVLRNTLIPVVTVIGLDITSLISGAVLTETVFSRPGLGSLAVGSISTRDFPTLQACLILFTVLVLIVNLVVDISYSLINPKIRSH
jgi:ABC-type dipeptide/oligopeptide/nickel transport system permease component